MKQLVIFVWIYIPFIGAAPQKKVDFTLERYELDQASKIQIYDISGIIFSKRRGEYHVKGAAKILKDIDNDLEIEVAIYKLQGNEYRLTPFKYKRTKFCEIIKTADEYYRQIPENSEIPAGCPIPKGSYKVDWKPDYSSAPSALTGRYKINTTAYYKNELNCNMVVYAEMQRYQVV